MQRIQAKVPPSPAQDAPGFQVKATANHNSGIASFDTEDFVMVPAQFPSKTEGPCCSRTPPTAAIMSEYERDVHVHYMNDQALVLQVRSHVTGEMGHLPRAAWCTTRKWNKRWIPLVFFPPSSDWFLSMSM